MAPQTSINFPIELLDLKLGILELYANSAIA